MNKLQKFFKIIISSIYPKKCVCCGEIIDEDKFLCDLCDQKIERMNIEQFCLDCGCETDECCCKYNIYRFSGVVSAFKNSGIAQKAYYSYKFSKKEHYSTFFAEEICKTVKNIYKDVDFDLICYVPSFRKYDYNHCAYIARKISQQLNLPLHSALLSCVKKCKKQHKSTIKERISNVENKYSSNYRIDNATVLLIDDIKTTGSTLDECAKILLYAGAKNVYCATVLGSAAKKAIEK